MTDETSEADGRSTPHAPRPEKRRRIERVVAACDLCKARKVKCDGELPCAYCQRKKRADTCIFTAPKQRSHAKSAGNTPTVSGPHQSFIGPLRHASSSGQVGSLAHVDEPDDCNASTDIARRRRTYSAGAERRPRPRTSDGVGEFGASLSRTNSREDHQNDTAVPLEGRILRDAQGKVIFIGDCAPLSFLQTVRHLIASEVDVEGLAVAASRDSIIEVAKTKKADGPTSLIVDVRNVEMLVGEYVVAVSGLADLFEHTQLLHELKAWASGFTSHQNGTSAVHYLILAIGAQESNEVQAESWFEHAKDVLLKHLTTSMTLSTVQGFTLVAVYMLRAFQPNGAYLYFSLAARTAYAIGLHRTEVNATYGAAVRDTRDRIWKSLRVVDMLISNLLGRPPSTSDVDCTVKYGKHGVAEVSFGHSLHIIDASVQIFMIIERVVVEVYSRKRISLRIASYVSHQLKGWASIWLRFLSDRTAASPFSTGVGDQDTFSREVVVGACSTLCSYYYGIMLLTRPFLIYELYEYMGASLKAPGTHNEHQEKRKYADAALDAATSFVETLEVVLKSNHMPQRMPLVVSWLFTTSLVLAVGILGRSGTAFEDHCRASIACLDYFAEVDPHARQYSLVVQALLKTTTTHVKARELRLRSQRKQASSQLFGLLPLDNEIPATQQSQLDQDASDALDRRPSTIGALENSHGQDASTETAIPDWTIYDADFFALPWLNESDQGLQDFLQPGRHTLDGENLADIPLFPMYDQMGGSFM